jgi:hypothetical protein
MMRIHPRARECVDMSTAINPNAAEPAVAAG